MKKSLKYGVAAAALTAVLVGGGALSAFATTSQTSFDGIANRFQQSRYFEYQTRTTGDSSQIRFSDIGGGYAMNVKAQNGSSGTEYKEEDDLGTGYTYSIPNSTPTGDQTRLIVTNHSWTTVTVAIAGWFKTN